jgi:5-formyltetrahydrofolate cyclo-ligase
MPFQTKTELRKTLLAQRESLAPSLRAAHGLIISERILQMPEYQCAEVVLGYMNFGAEFACDAWVERVLAAGKRLLLPKVNAQSKQLDLYWVTDVQQQLRPGLWGIREPLVECCERFDSANEVEFALIPGVGFSRDGARLGYGGGFYDKLLARMARRPVLAAAAFGVQLVAHIPQEATDVKVAWIITEQEIIACSANDNFAVTKSGEWRDG